MEVSNFEKEPGTLKEEGKGEKNYQNLLEIAQLGSRLQPQDGLPSHALVNSLTFMQATKQQ
ncbi:hypothetical protein ACOSQ2_004717 [Xanthoceras sorbifolium]